MKYLRCILLCACLAFSVKGTGQKALNDSTLLNIVERFGQAEVEIAYPGYNKMTSFAEHFSVSSCNGEKAVLSLSWLTVNDFISEDINYKIISPSESKSVYTASSVSEAMEWHSYPTWQQYDTIMHLLASSRPDICLLDTIGYSVLGRPILVLKISDNVEQDETEPAVFLTASIHGDELGGFVLMMRLAEKLINESGDGGLVEKLVSGLDIWINPLSNPDGMYHGEDTIINPTRANENGYDLNRNFPDPEVTLSPLQLENEYMIAFLHEKRFVISANIHAGSEVVNYPWDKWTRLHADDQWLYDISRRYADTVHLYAETDYMTFKDNGVTNGAAWYTIRGGRQDYVTYGLQGRELTLELDNIKQTPAAELENRWNANYRSFLRLMEEALFSVHGVVTDAETGLPLGAKIVVAGHDVDSSHVYSDTLSGNFCRYLSPGTWNLTFTCNGYYPYVAGDIEVSWDEMTWLDIQLLPRSYPEPLSSELLIYPSLSAGEVSILAPLEIEGSVRINVYNSAGNIITSYNTVVVQGIPVDDDFGSLASGVYIVTMKKLPTGPEARGKLVIRHID